MKAPLIAAALVAVCSAQAAEPFRTYDNFSTTPIDLGRWFNAENVRAIERGALRLMQRNYGLTSSDAGLSFSNWSESLTNAAAVTALKARITVNALEVASCPANASLGQSRARIAGAFFNTGTPTPGSELGDMFVQVRLTRFSNSTDPAGVLRVQGIAAVCTTADCNSTRLIGSIVDLGTVSLGQATTVSMQWDQPSKSFTFLRDNGAFSGVVSYTEDDTNPPGSAFKQLSTRMDLPNCASAARTVGSVDARFDNIAVNQSAAP